MIADALSRNPRKSTDTQLADEVELFVDSVMAQLPVTQNRLSKLRDATVHDSEMNDLMNYVMNGWPVVSAIAPALKLFYEARDQLSVVDGLLTFQNRLVVPRGQRSEILARLHEAHQGFRKCYDNAERCVWWPGLRGELKTLSHYFTQYNWSSTLSCPNGKSSQHEIASSSNSPLAAVPE